MKHYGWGPDDLNFEQDDATKHNIKVSKGQVRAKCKQGGGTSKIGAILKAQKAPSVQNMPSTFLR